MVNQNTDNKIHEDYNWKDKWLSAIINSEWKLWWLSHELSTPIVKDISNELRDLLQHMFCSDTGYQRASLSQVFNHEWMNEPSMFKF